MTSTPHVEYSPDEITSAPRTGGIYSIQNTDNEKLYIGSAVSFYGRWCRHRFDLQKGIHHSPHLQHAWNKYGANVFRFVVVEHIADKTLLLAREQHWINTLQPAYNIAPIAGSSLGVKRSQMPKEQRDKISAALKGRPKSEATKANMRAAWVKRKQRMKGD